MLTLGHHEEPRFPRRLPPPSHPCQEAQEYLGSPYRVCHSLSGGQGSRKQLGLTSDRETCQQSDWAKEPQPPGGEAPLPPSASPGCLRQLLSGGEMEPSRSTTGTRPLA